MDNKMMLIFLWIIFNKKSNEKNLNVKEDIESLEENIPEEVPVEYEKNTFTLDIPRTKGKVKIMKKIGPYFPPEYISPINKSIVITERILRLYETMDFMENSQVNYIQTSIPVENNKERINYIMNTIKNEVPREDVKNMGMLLDVIINMDKYKGLFTTFSSIISDSNVLNDPNKMLKIIEPLMEGQSSEEKKKMKEMIKMFELMQNLDKK